MKFLIAGLGSIGRRHLKNLITLGENQLVLFRTHHSTLPQDELAEFPVETDLNEALQHQPDAVIISNPTAFHMQVAIPCAKAGCALFIEKPIAYHPDELSEFEKIIQQNRNVVFSAFQFRFNPGLQKIHDMLENETAGRPLSFSCHWGEYLPDWHPWEDYKLSYAARKEMGGGVVLTLCHPLDYLRWFFGDVSEICSLTGQISDLEIDVEDYAQSVIRFKNGVCGDLHTDYYRKPKRHDLEIACSNGTIFWEYETSNVKWIKPDGGTEIFKAPEVFDRNDMYLKEMEFFINLVNSEGTLHEGFSDGKKTLELAWAILHSGRYKKWVYFD